jgi:MoaA/NifB/PqqE/SkfB family radical SAM enzyme
MTTEEWERLVDEAAAMGVRRIQFIGGEPAAHPGLARLVRHAVAAGLKVEVFSNLLHVSADQWAAFMLPGVSLATSWYSPDPGMHARITGRANAHARTLANIREARDRGISVRAAFIDIYDGQDLDAARAGMAALGVTVDAHADRVRQVGRGARAGAAARPDVAELCGRCGRGQAAVSPDGEVSPCVIGSWLTAGSVRRQSLAEIVHGDRMRELVASIPGPRSGCGPDNKDGCQPDNQGKCQPKQDGQDCAPSEREACGPKYCNPDLRK